MRRVLQVYTGVALELGVMNPSRPGSADGSGIRVAVEQECHHFAESPR